LPSQYEEELINRSRLIEDNLNIIQSTSLNQEQRIMLQKFIEMSFKESLQMSGDQRQLDHLSIITNNALNQNQIPQMGITNSSV
jgi:acetyl-CoA carboxylase alpha subunit